MKLGLILVLVALLVPTVLWLVWGDGWDIELREGVLDELYLSALAGGYQWRQWVREPIVLPLRYVLACSAALAGVGVYLLVTARARSA
jgi:hypothetical protein